MTRDRIQEQVKLSPKVALEVVLQGIKIRFGRSLVTISGVALGIAFLMSIFTGQAIKEGVEQEESLRADINRMKSFLAAEMGPLAQRKIGIIQVGPLSTLETRLVRSFIEDSEVAELRWASYETSAPVPEVENIQQVSLEQVGQDVSSVIVLGERSGDLDLEFADILGSARQQVVADTRRDRQLQNLPAEPVMLQQEMRQEEIEEKQAQEAKQDFRNWWILIISLLVTVIGISNAMLMSVTERFREIGTMKCLGALSSFIRQIFLIESSLVGLIGAVAGALFGMIFSTIAYGFTYGVGLVLTSVDYPRLLLSLLISIVIGVALSVIAAIYPANFASRMVPATALRTNI
jgi:hypothetical protein